MPFRRIHYQKKDRIGWITLNSPETGNAIDIQMAQEIAEACQQIAQDDEVVVAVIAGSGEQFSCGEDLEELAALIEPGSAFAEAAKTGRFYGVAGCIAAIDRPVIAAVNGDALGQGLELILACDLRVASRAARFGFPHAPRGIMPRDGGTQRLPRLVGKGKALEMLLTGDLIDAQEAHRIGLVHRIVSPEEVLSEAENLARKLADRAPIALRYAKEAVHKGMDLTLEQGLRLECDLYLILQTTEDRTEGIRAFREKKVPDFKGR
jgi:enoyl-CoA hydratase